MAYVQQIGWYNLSVPPSLQLVTYRNTYLFNVGENSQRFRYTHKLSIGKIACVFLTAVNSSTVDGLTGILLAVERTSVETLRIFGPPPTKALVEAIKEQSFINPTLEVYAHEITETTFVELAREDGVVIYGASHGGDTDYGELHVVDSVVNLNVAYLIAFDNELGPFLPNEARRLGVSRVLALCISTITQVTKGSDFGRLKKGQAVQVADGSWVQPQQVIGSPLRGKKALIMHSNGPASLENVGTYGDNVNFVQVDKARNLVGRLDYVFWMSTTDSEDLVEAKAPYAMKIRCDAPFFETRKHVALTKAHYLNSVHATFAPQLFPTPPNPQDMFFGFAVDDDEHEDQPKYSTFLRPLTKIVMHPAHKATVVEDFACCGYSQELFDKDDVPIMDILDDSLLSDPSITFLGTGCATPGPIRNVSGILLSLSKTCAVILDAGRNTVGMIVVTPPRLRAIVVSHSHGDHYVGVCSLLAYRYKYGKKCKVEGRPTVFAPARILQWMEFYKNNVSPIDYEGIETVIGGSHTVPVCDSGMQFNFFAVDHISDSVGVRITHDAVGSVVYSGDTRPCDSLIEGAMDCDVLIQEGTTMRNTQTCSAASFNDRDHAQATSRYHTTFSEAVEIGEQCRARATILTHFSQRYRSIELDVEPRNDIIVAHDLMRIPIKAISTIAEPMLIAAEELNLVLNQISD
ncbi:Ribonuclease mitochondrial, putative [Babesia ovata]|uniref:ribonuclease Z n=1 Tax=Babesia ovata TaxID=189622 RepID=A0A2H6KFL7_9APIC|nr:Ribonuclease mitochondrial, putative [Babesia ovata]GBE61793.1 Ribonuclease mitochondrial, putative [Babesia ovata]